MWQIAGAFLEGVWHYCIFNFFIPSALLYSKCLGNRGRMCGVVMKQRAVIIICIVLHLV